MSSLLRARLRHFGGLLLWLGCLSALGAPGCKSDEPASPITGEMGKVRGPCYPNLTCNAGLACLSEVCVRLTDGGHDALEAGPSEAGAGDGSRDAGGPDATPCSSACGTTVAGSGVAGFAEGPALAAQLHSPTGLTFDGAGRLLIADRDNHRIRVLRADGALGTLCGSGAAGFVNGPALTAELRAPTGVTFSEQVLYIADAGNHAIRRLVGGVVETVAGSGQEGLQNASGDLTKALFSSPRGVARDGWGTLFVGDTGNNILRQITSNSTAYVSGSRPGIWGIATDSLGTAFFVTSADHRVYRYAAGSVDLVAGADSRGYLDGHVAAARFDSPRGIFALDDGDLLIADTGNHRIRRVRGDQVETLAGQDVGDADGPLAQVRFNGPSAVVVGPDGAIYVADTNNHRVRVLRP